MICLFGGILCVEEGFEGRVVGAEERKTGYGWCFFFRFLGGSCEEEVWNWKEVGERRECICFLCVEDDVR